MRGDLEDTICAVATPAGIGGIGIVRLSGSHALSIAVSLVRLRSGNPLSSVATHTLHLADLVISSRTSNRGTPRDGSTDAPGTVLDEALVVLMKSPRSFTGEDVVEIQTHGGSTVLSLLCRACVQSGARLAEPGEFTKRAFLNGRLDLSQAEAVLDTIRAKSAMSLIVAQRQLRGDLAREIDSARAALVALLGHLEAGIDFVEEDISFVQKGEMEKTIGNVLGLIRGLRDTAREGRLLREGARVAIVGTPNVGKSSLLNRLLREERAIVTATPGTTRDIVEGSIDLEGVTVTLVDTAGIRETNDEIEREGIKRARSAQVESDLQLIVVDGSIPLSGHDRSLLERCVGENHIVVINKTDLALHVEAASIAKGSVTVSVSARSGAGIDELKSMMRAHLVGGGSEPGDGVMITNVRHQAALDRSVRSLEQAGLSIAGDMESELVAMDVRQAAEALGEITGVITTDEILDRVFSEFCIGK